MTNEQRKQRYRIGEDPERDAAVVAAVKAGKSHREAVEEFGPSKGTVLRLLRGDTPPDGDKHLWDEYVSAAAAYIAKGKIERDELNYKRELADNLRLARQALLRGDDTWRASLKRAFAGRQGHPVHFIILSDTRSWIDREPEAARQALQELWLEDDNPATDRIPDFRERVPEELAKKARTANLTVLFSVLLMGLNVEEYPPYNYTVLNRAYSRTGFGPSDSDLDEAGRYEYELDFLDQFIEEADERGLELPNRLYAQSVVWQIDGEPSVDEEPFEEEPTPEPEPSKTLDDLAEELYLPAEFLQDIVALLEDKKQIIFQGPPGTGKTYVAQKLARHLAGRQENVTLVQFHPSYSYEDFVQGYRPVLEDGQPGFELRDGPLKRAADKARDDSSNNHYLIIDEINRGNLASVFGELYFLLEYRDEEIRLQYDDKPFKLPPNLYIIGTMNTADRSIALVDLALRRRFYFAEFHPDQEPVRSVLRKFLDATQSDMTWVAGVVDAANDKLKDDRHAAIGPSYFMKDDLDDDMVKRIWTHSVLPYIEERRFGDERVAGEFSLDTLQRERSVQNAPPASDDEAESDAT